MAQKAYIIEGISGKDILEHEPIASQIAEGFQVSSINAFDKDGKSMCLVLLSDGESSGGGGSDGESSGGGSSSDTIAPPVFSPDDTITTSGRRFSNSIEVTITAEDADAIIYNTTGLENNDAWTEYVEPITLTASTTIFARAGKYSGDDLPALSPVAVAYYEIFDEK